MSLPLLFLAARVSGAENGVWTPEPNFAQVNVACSRVYRCAPATDVLHSADTKVVSTSPKLVWGVCSASGGAVDSCNTCLTNPPADRCEWHTEPK